MRPTLEQLAKIDKETKRLAFILLPGFGYDSMNNINFQCYSKYDQDEEKEIYRGKINGLNISFSDMVELRKIN